MNGCFIVIEGPDGSGTTTHASLLAERLRNDGFDVLETAEPTSGPIGTFIRSELQLGHMPAEALQMLFSADRSWHVTQMVLPALEKGTIVISDRYIASTLMYGEALGLEGEWLKNMNYKFIQPDLELFALPSFQVCSERLGLRATKDMLEGETLQKKVYDGYSTYANENPHVVVIDTGSSLEDTANEFYAATKQVLPKR